MFTAILISLFRVFAPTVDDANVDVAALYGVDEFFNPLTDETLSCDDVPVEAQAYDCRARMRWAMLAISNRENPGHWSPDRRYTGIHAGDSRHAGNVHKRARGFGRLSSWCPSHWTPEGLSTVGPHGLMYGYNVQRLGVVGNCVPTWAFGLAPVSARAAADRYLSLCATAPGTSVQPGGWCPTTKQIERTRIKHRRLAWRAARAARRAGT